MMVLLLAHSSLVLAKPSVPEFTAKFVDNSYDKPITYSIDPYTGQDIPNTIYHMENKSIIVRIKNQPFVPFYNMSSGSNISMYYNIRIKGHYGENWTNLYQTKDLISSKIDSEYTILSYPLDPNNENTYILGGIKQEFPPGGQIDFQVEAMTGYVYRGYDPNAVLNPSLMYPYVFAGETSGWSNTQTVIITDLETSPSMIPSQEKSQLPKPQNIMPSLIALALLSIASIAAIGVGSIVSNKKR